MLLGACWKAGNEMEWKLEGAQRYAKTTPLQRVFTTTYVPKFNSCFSQLFFCRHVSQNSPPGPSIAEYLFFLDWISRPYLVPPPCHGWFLLLAFCNPWNEEAGECEHVLGVRICPVSIVSKWLTISKWWTIPMLNRKEQRSELFWSLSGTHTFRLPYHRHMQQLFNPVNVLISKFFNGQTDWLTDWLTDGQNRLLNPFVHVRAG